MVPLAFNIVRKSSFVLRMRFLVIFFYMLMYKQKLAAKLFYVYVRGGDGVVGKFCM